MTLTGIDQNSVEASHTPNLLRQVSRLLGSLPPISPLLKGRMTALSGGGGDPWAALTDSSNLQEDLFGGK